MAIQQQPSQAQVSAYNNLVAVASSDFFSQADGTWLKLEFVKDSWSALTLNNLAKRLQGYLDLGFTPFPSFLKEHRIVVVDYLDSFAVKAMQQAGCHVSFAYYNCRTRLFEGAEFMGLPAFDLLGPNVNLPESTTYEEYKELIAAGNYLFVSESSDLGMNLGEIQIKHICEHLQSKTIEEKAKFLACYTGFDVNHEQPLQVSLKPFDADESVYASALFDFANSTVHTTREFKLRGTFFIKGVGEVDKATCMVLLGLQLAAFNGAGQIEIDTVINLLTQAWEEEDVYGSQMDSCEQLRTIRNNSVALLKTVATYELPYYRLANNNNASGVAEACNWYDKHQIPFFTDKYGCKRVVTRAGVAALWIGMMWNEDNFGVMSTITDIKKLSKLLNRGWNAVAISASEGIPDTEGYRPYQYSALQIKYLNEVIRIKGDKVNCLFHNGRFANNGSGVGYTTTNYSYTVRKTLRGTFNATNLRKGQTLEDVKEQLEKELEALITSNKVIKSSDHKGVKTLLAANGVTLLEYRGLNQDVLLSKEHGCSYKVRKLRTSQSLSIELNIIFFSSDMEIKSRGLGIKAVLRDGRHVVTTDAAGNLVEWQNMYNMECQKGTSARLHLYAEYLWDKFGQPTFYVSLKGGLEYPISETEYAFQDLSDNSAPFYQWSKDAMKTYHVHDWVGMSYFIFVLLGNAKLLHRKHEAGIIDEALAHPVNNDIQLVNPRTMEVTNNLSEALNEDGSGVFIREVVKGIQGNYTVQVEVSTPRENTGVQASTLEQVAAVYASRSNLGEALAATGDDAEQAVMGMVAMATNDPTLLL